MPEPTLRDHLFSAVLNLLNREVSEHGRHLTQYFHLFLMYASLGVAEKQQLLKMDVASSLMLVALDEGPGPPIKYQYAELGKLYSVVSLLVRCCDVSARCQSSVQGQAPLPNPHGDPALTQPICVVQTQVEEILFGKPSYLKKVIEDCNSHEDTLKLLRFCCWENPHFSSSVLSELLWHVAYSYTYELRPHLDLLLHMLLLEDSWQTHRILNALKGIPDDRDGLFDTIQRSKNHYQKRAYQCIKMMVALFSRCAQAGQMLQSHGDLKKKWTYAVEWLNDELERVSDNKRPYSGSAQYTYNSWSPPAQSNETANGYFLERSHSAKVTLAKAYELCPEEEPEEQETDEHESMSTEERTAARTPAQPAQQVVCQVDKSASSTSPRNARPDARSPAEVKDARSPTEGKHSDAPADNKSTESPSDSRSPQDTVQKTGRDKTKADNVKSVGKMGSLGGSNAETGEEEVAVKTTDTAKDVSSSVSTSVVSSQDETSNNKPATPSTTSVKSPALSVKSPARKDPEPDTTDSEKTT